MLIAFGIILGVIVLLLGICLARALMCCPTTSRPAPVDPARAAAYAEKLSTMVRCETVSRRGQPEPEKWAKGANSAARSQYRYCLFFMTGSFRF